MLTAAGAFAYAHTCSSGSRPPGLAFSFPTDADRSVFPEGIEPAFSGVTVTGPQQHAVATGKTDPQRR